MNYRRSKAGSRLIVILTTVMMFVWAGSYVLEAKAQSSVGSPAAIKKVPISTVEAKAVTAPAPAAAPPKTANIVYVPVPVETITIIDVRTGNRYNLYLTDPGIRYFIDNRSGASRVEMTIDSQKVLSADRVTDVQVHVNSNKVFQDAMEHRAGPNQ